MIIAWSWPLTCFSFKFIDFTFFFVLNYLEFSVLHTTQLALFPH